LRIVMRKPKKSRSSYHHGDLRNAALSAAERILERGGVEGLTLRRVARDAGVSPMALYNHFDDKQALLCALAEDACVALRVAIEAAAPGHVPPLDRLRRGAVAYVMFAVENRRRFELIFGGVGAALVADPRLRDAAQSTFATLRECLSDCARVGLLRADPVSAERAMWGAAHGYACLRNAVPFVMRGDSSEIRRNAEQMFTAIIEGLRADGGRASVRAVKAGRASRRGADRGTP
jgi:AcrR family transcriptional regulator